MHNVYCLHKQIKHNNKQRGIYFFDIHFFFPFLEKRKAAAKSTKITVNISFSLKCGRFRAHDNHHLYIKPTPKLLLVAEFPFIFKAYKL